MNQKQHFIWVSLFFTFFLIQVTLEAQEPVILDSKMKPGISNDMRIEELKVRWKKAALENCPGVPCVTTPPAPSFTCGTSKVTDIDGNQYNTVLIGTQCWLKENLRVTMYNNNDPIPLDQSGGTAGNSTPTQTWSGHSNGARTLYEHNPAYLNNLGFLYNWYAAVDSRGICPDGWKVPTKLEWQSLESFLSTGGDAGLKMMVTSTPYGWATFSKTNSSGFTALSSGYRLGNGGNSSFFGRFLRAGVPGASGILYARWWSTDSVSPTSKDEAVLEDQNSGGFYLNTSEPTQGASIRCIKK
ncbi:MAG: fibrobacter succinogenes major paralogous domain-containing protein [Saprospiraceae bacterium]|nr:fibrobacter succinogenes major paralogous domain-containing protein [Saprospiraceae bacterium]